MKLLRAHRPLALLLCLAFAAAGCGAASGTVADMPQASVLASIEAGHAPLLIDVRTPEEFARGHVPGARNIPIDELAPRTDELAAHRDGELVVYCETGRRAAKASVLLAEAGFTRVRHLDGDMAAWRSAGLPVE